MKNIKIKGIVDHSSNYSLFGLRLPFIGLILGVIREKRYIEAFYGIYCEIFYKPGICAIYPKSNNAYKSEFYAIDVNNIKLNYRSESMYCNNGTFIAGEYGQPGARILFKKNNITKLFDPYLNDSRVFHIHSICHFKDDLFLIAVGDTAKYLDLIEINENECIIKKRIFKHFGGFTSLLNINGKIWAGTDFSRRPNYIIEIQTGKKYFLPNIAFRQYVLNIQSINDKLLKITTKELNNMKGCELYFNTHELIFQSCCEINVIESTKLYHNNLA